MKQILQHKITKRYVASIVNGFVDTTKMIEDAKRWRDEKAVNRFIKNHKEKLIDCEVINDESL